MFGLPKECGVADEVLAKGDDVSDAGKAFGCYMHKIKHLYHQQLPEFYWIIALCLSSAADCTKQ